MSTAEQQEPDRCLCGQPHPCPLHSFEAIEAEFRRLGPPPLGCRCSLCSRAAARALRPVSRFERKASAGPPPAEPTPDPEILRVDERRWAVADLEDAALAPLDVLDWPDRRRLLRARRRGWLSTEEAEWWAEVVGMDAAEIWPEMDEPTGGERP